MNTPAPNFGKSAYPLAGERIGPAWAEMWSALDDRTWTEGVFLSRILAPKHALNPKTINNLLYEAVRFGILVKRLKNDRYGRRAYYRVAKQNLTA